MALSKLEREIAQTQSSLEKMKPPRRKEGLALQFHDQSLELPIRQWGNTVKGAKDEKMETAYKTIILEFEKIKFGFNNAAKKIVEEGDFSEGHKKKFAQLTIQYYTALEVVAECQLHMAKEARKKNRRVMVAEEKEHDILKDNIISYKRTVESVALTVADHQLRNINEGEVVRLNEVIPYIKTTYDKAYQEEHNPFWRWIKSIFKKSDRAREIEFLNQISQHEACTEFVRFQAARLVHDKIVNTEWFGEGSKLGKFLGAVIDKGEFFVDKKNNENLVHFIHEHHLEDQMPESLKDYLADNDATYQEQAAKVFGKRG